MPGFILVILSTFFFPSSFFVQFSFFTHSLKIYPILDTKIGLEEMEVNMNAHLG